MSTFDGTISTPATIYRNRGTVGIHLMLTTDECDTVAVDISDVTDIESSARDFAHRATCGSRIVVEGALCHVTDIRTGRRQTKISGNQLPEITASYNVHAA